jgi:uncharacterized protein (TIGR00730 family)
MNTMKAIAVFCGSGSGAGDHYREAAYAAGQALAARNIRLVYGGARVGLMGAVADGALDGGGEVTGVIPAFLRTKEIAHEGLTELIITETMHERKLRMHELSDGILTLPGGFGTMEELFEMLTWGQLGLHRKPVGVLNIRGFYDPLLQLAETMVREAFLSRANADMLLVNDAIGPLLEAMQGYTAPEAPKWIREETT